KALAIPDTGDDARYRFYRHYARGEALLLKGDLKGAIAEQKLLHKDPGGAAPEEKAVADDVLAGRILMVQGKPREARQVFERAAKLQEAKLSARWDPPSWWYPVRRSVAAAYLKAGDYKRAEAEAETSLKAWKKDPLALWVLGKAQLAEGHLGAGEATI